MRPGPVLAGLAEEAAGPYGRCAQASDDELIGVLRAFGRLESWAAGRRLAVIAELIRRRPAPGGAPAGDAAGDLAGEAGMPAGWGRYCGDELAVAAASSAQAAEKTLELAYDLATRLPGTARALCAGVIDLYKARIIAEATRVLSREETAAVEERVLAGLPGLAGRTPGQLRAALARAVAAVNPAAAAARRERAQKDARVELWREEAGTAALCGRDLPPAQALAADQAITDYALELKAAGLEGTMDRLRARAFLDLTLGVRSHPTTPPTPGDPAGPRGPEGPPRPGGPHPGEHPHGPHCQNPGRPGPGGQPGSPGPGGQPGSPGRGDDTNGPYPGAQPHRSAAGNPAGAGSGAGPAGNTAEDNARAGQADPNRPEGPGGPGVGGATGSPGGSSPPGLAARINLTIPLATLLGLADRPGEMSGLGAIDPALARELARSAAASPRTTWCLTVTDAHGHPTGHGCARPARTGRSRTRRRDGPGAPGGPGARNGPRTPGGPGARNGPRTPRGPGARSGPGNGDRPGTRGGPGPQATFTQDHDHGPPGGYGRWRLRLSGDHERIIDLEPLAITDCDHRHQSAGYQPSGTLRHLVEIRDGECNWPPCRRTARRCDFEHAIPWDQGGRTCACNAGPRCRHHHQKQAHGWKLEQHLPGYHTWTTPAGRTYTTGPVTYPV